MISRRSVPIIGLAGGIGSGKSTLARGLAGRRNVVVIDGDAAGHEVLKEAEIKNAIRRRFGEAVFDASGEVDRRALADLVFGASADQRRNRADLEQIVHPAIREKFRETIAQAEASQEIEAVIVDAAVLIEAGWDDLCDAVVFVDASEEMRRRRVAEGRGWSEEQMKTREASQLPLEQKRQAARYVIENNGPPADAAARLETILDHLN